MTVRDPNVIVIATRGSALALAQARQVQALLTARGIESKLETYKTVGDKKLGVPLHEIGDKGIFTKELERDLAKGKVDCCVHSLKDLATQSPPGLEIVAMLEREDPRDVLLVHDSVGASTLAELPSGSRVGTSSLRRRALLLATRRDLEGVELRGNVPTRVQKVDEGKVHAAILAAAGLIRLGITGRISSYLQAPAWLPAAGQGAIAIQIRANDSRARDIFTPLGHAATMLDVSAERAFLAELEGGCQVPIGALVIRDAGGAVLHGFISDLAGITVVRGRRALDAANPKATGIEMAEEMREGASEILAALRRA